MKLAVRYIIKILIKLKVSIEINSHSSLTNQSHHHLILRVISIFLELFYLYEINIITYVTLKNKWNIKKQNTTVDANITGTKNNNISKFSSETPEN